MTTVHIPILLEPIVRALSEPLKALPLGAPAHWIVDSTLGGGGHTDGLLKALAADPALRQHRVLSVDQDLSAVEQARVRFAGELEAGALEIVHARFSEVGPLIRARPVIGLMADLGFSSDQIQDPARGLSFMGDGPLDMRLDPSRGQSAREFLAQISERELVQVLSEWGEERFSKRIAATIIRARQEARLPQTTGELADLIVKSVPPEARYGRIHAATRTFQALRIAVNDELGELEVLLNDVILGIRSAGRVAILSFHSLEDRKVKVAFKGSEEFRPLTKKPMKADEAEISRNPRSRSAKLRIAERI